MPGSGSAEETEDRAMERPGRDVAHSSTTSPYAHGIPAPIAVMIVFLLALGIGKEFSSDPSPIAHPPGEILIPWAKVVKEFRAAAVDCKYNDQRIVSSEPFDEAQEELILRVLGGPSKFEVKMRARDLIAIELRHCELFIPPEATELRYHSSNLAALSAAMAYGSEVPPVRLAVGESATIPKGKKPSPGIYYSDNVPGCVYYAHGGPYGIGITMVLQPSRNGVFFRQ